MPDFSSIADIVYIVSTLLIFAIIGFGIRQKLLRGQELKAQFERIKGNGKCEGAAALPEGAELLVTTDKTAFNTVQGEIRIKGKDLFVARCLLGDDTAWLCAWYATPYMRISLDDVEYCQVVTGQCLVLGLPSVPCEATVLYNPDEREISGWEKLAAALKQHLKCDIENEAALYPSQVKSSRAPVADVRK
jgi:hypothetical protein